MNEEERKKLEEERRVINEKINASYLTSEEERKYFLIKDKLGKDLRKIKKPIYLRYYKEYPMRSWKGGIKSSVKQGIKFSLGAKSLKEIDDEDIRSLVKRFILEDLKETEAHKILFKTKKIEEELKKIRENKYSEREKLSKRVETINYKLNKKEIDKKNMIEKRMEEIKERITKMDNKLFDIIKREVNKRLVLERLENDR
jgi:hypothetical protein